MAAEVTMIYFAAPIDGVRADDVRLPWHEIREQTMVHARGHSGVIGFHPVRAFSVGLDSPVTSKIEAINRAALSAADGLVALVPKGVPSVGVPREIEAARIAGKPVAVLTDMTNSFSLADEQRFPLSLRGMTEAILWIQSVVRGRTRVIHPREVVFSVGPNGKMPTRAYATDAGYDLYASERTWVEPGEFVDIQTDLRVAMPEEMWGRIVGRSSTLRRRGLLVIEGVIDAGYRGPIYTGVQNMGTDPVDVLPGERLAQFIPHLNVASMVHIREADETAFDALPHDGRGTGGFGSSGH